MTQAEVYYFTGTGNSLAVARDVAARLEARLISIAAVLNEGRPSTQAEVVGVVFPLYDFKPPRLVEQFIRQLPDLGPKYLFALCTYGVAAGHALPYLDGVLQTCGGRLAAGWAVEMPHNAIGSRALPTARHEVLFKNWQDRIEGIGAYISAGKQGQIESSSLLPALLQPRFIRMAPALLSFLKQVLLKGVQSLALVAGPTCQGCGTCARLCPMHNIALVDGRPAWSDRCASCFACLQWCPQQAISLGGVDLAVGRYHHPAVTLDDMLRPRS